MTKISPPLNLSFTNFNLVQSSVNAADLLVSRRYMSIDNLKLTTIGYKSLQAYYKRIGPVLRYVLSIVSTLSKWQSIKILAGLSIILHYSDKIIFWIKLKICTQVKQYYYRIKYSFECYICSYSCFKYGFGIILLFTI